MDASVWCLNHAGFEPNRQASLWAEATATAIKLDNILIHNSNTKTPHERFYGQPTKYQDHLRVFGKVGIITKTNTSSIKSKLQDRGLVGIFLGYARYHAGDAYRMLNPTTHKVWITWDVKWLNKQYHEHHKLKTCVILLDLDDDHLKDPNEHTAFTLPTCPTAVNQEAMTRTLPLKTKTKAMQWTQPTQL